MWRSPRVIAIALSTLTVLIASLLIAQFYSTGEPIIIEETAGDSTVYIEARHNAILFPGECLEVNWEINGINAVFIQTKHGYRGTTGLDKAVFCIWSDNDNPTLRVEFPDSSTESYVLDIQHLYASPLITGGLIVTIIAGCVLAYFTIGMSAVVVILTLVCFVPILSMNSSFEMDFSSHIYWANIARSSGSFEDMPPHFVFHYMTIQLSNIVNGMSLIRSAFFVTLTSQVGTALGFYTLFNMLDARTRDKPYLKIIYGFVAVSLLLVGPITYFLMGFRLPRTTALLYANTYHSPTMIVMRMFAVWLFVTIISIPAKWSKRVILYLLAIIILLLLASFSKPNYTLVIVPAYLVLMVLNFVRYRQVKLNTILVLVTLIITASVALGWQYFAVFSDESTNIIASERSEILVQWFGLYTTWESPPQKAVVEWFVSLIFPIAVYLLYLKKAWKDDALNLSWIALCGAIAMAVLFIEVPRTDHGNFVWGTRITTLITFGVSASFLIRQPEIWTWQALKSDWRFWICAMLFIVHVVHYIIAIIQFYG